MPNNKIRSAHVVWTKQQREAVLRRVKDYVMPPSLDDASWETGCSAVFLSRMREHWLDGFDWNAAVDRLNRYPQYLTDIDGIDVHFAHIRAERPNAPPLLLIHGWPSAYFEFWDVVNLLTNPSQYGGRAEDAVELIIPSLPGFGFSGKPVTAIGPRAVARIFDTLMVDRLGHFQYLSHGGDWGATVTSWLGVDHSAHVRAIHLSLIALPQPTRPETPEDETWMAAYAAVQRELGGYSHLQGTKPQSLAWLAAGNPVGQAAWIAERLHDWSDLRERDFETIFPLDWIITLALTYYMTDSFRTSALLYYGLASESSGSVTTIPSGARCQTPTAFTVQTADRRVVPPPRDRIERAYNIVRWRTANRGGHFPAIEQPTALAEDLLDWRRTTWSD